MNQEPEIRDWTQDMEASESDLPGRARQLLAQGNARRFLLRNAQDEVLLDLPLTPTLILGGVATFAFPTVAAIAAIGALFAKLKVDIERVEDSEDLAPAPPKEWLTLVEDDEDPDEPIELPLEDDRVRSPGED